MRYSLRVAFLGVTLVAVILALWANRATRQRQIVGHIHALGGAVGYAVAAGHDGNVYVADSSNNRIQQFAVPEPSQLGDTNGDGFVNINDLNAVRNNFGVTGPADGTLEGDAFPFDGFVNIIDLNGVRNNFGASAAVPEPSTLALASLFAFVAVVARRRRS